MSRFYSKPTEEDILRINDFRDEYYNQAMEHAEIMINNAFITKERKNRKWS